MAEAAAKKKANKKETAWRRVSTSAEVEERRRLSTLRAFEKARAKLSYALRALAIKHPCFGFLKILKKHGHEKVLFATDSPWSDAAKAVESVRNMPLEQKVIEDILSGNAKKILNI